MNTLKSICLVLAVLFFAALVTISSSFTFTMIIAFGFGILCYINYKFWISSTEEDHYNYTGASWIKTHFNIDILSDED